MSLLQIKNNARTTLTASLTNVATTATVLDASVLPALGAGEYFYLTFQRFLDVSLHEIVKVTAVAGNNLTIERGAEGSTPLSFSIGDIAEQRITALTLTDLLDEKQDTLVNQTNIKSINGETLLGSGDLNVSAGSGGYAANVYLTTIVSTTVPAYSQISYTPEPAETILDTIVNSNEVLVEDYIFDGDVLTDIMPAGEWGFHFHRYVSNAGNVSTLRFEVFSRAAGGTETVLFSATSKHISDLVSTLDVILITQPAFNINATDRIGIKVYAATTRNSDTTISLVVGDGFAMYFTTPLELRHNQLRARDTADAHPISAITSLQAELDSKINVSERGANSGVAELNTFGHVPEDQLAAGGGDATKYLRGDGLWTAIAEGGGLGAIPFYRADGSRDDINLEALLELLTLSITTQLSLGNTANILVGNAFGWTDLKAPIQAGLGQTDPTLTVYRDGIVLPAFQDNKTDEFQAQFHINHDYAPGTNLYPHVHYTVNTTNTGTVRWGFEYTVAKGHQQAGTDSVFEATTTVYVEQAIDGTQYKHYIAEIADVDAIDSVKVEPDSVTLVRVFRDSGHANDTFVGDIFGITVDIHQQVGRFATKNKTPDFYT